MTGCGCVPVKLCLQKWDAGHIWFTGHFAYPFGKICFFLLDLLIFWFFFSENFLPEYIYYTILISATWLCSFPYIMRGFFQVCPEGKDIFSDQKWHLKTGVVVVGGPCCAYLWNFFWIFKVCSWKVYCKRNKKVLFYRIKFIGTYW